MTDKQKIIDGIDVSKCEFYNKVIGEDGYCNIDEEHLCTCISYDNCHYKLYKCKEQECEELNNIITSLENTKEKILTKLDQLKAELEKYKQLANSFEADFYNALSDKESNYVKNLKQALQEIKEIAKDECKNCTVKLLLEDEINCKRCYKTKILQKCEVINE